MSLKVISATELILSYPDGYENVDLEIEATSEGIDLGWHGTIPWEWIDKARAAVSGPSSEVR